MRHRAITSFCIAVLCCFASQVLVFAQGLGPSETTAYAYDSGQPRGRIEPATEAARLAGSQGLKLSLRHDYAAAAQQYRLAVEADPRFESSHRSFILMTREAATRADPEHPEAAEAAATKQLIQAYDTWIRQQPKQAAFLVGKAAIYQFASHESDSLLRQAIAVDPMYLAAYQQLEASDLQHGDLKDRRLVLQKIASLSPQNPLAALAYVSTFRHASRIRMMSGRNVELFQVMLQAEIYTKYPDNVVVIRGLAMQAADAPNEALRLQYLEKASGYVSKFPTDLQLRVLMGSLFRLYSDTDPGRAETLAEEMIKAYPDLKNWIDLLHFQTLVNHASAALDAGKNKDAVLLLQQAVPMTDSLKLDVTRPWMLLARAYAGLGEAKTGYEILLAHTAGFPHKMLVDSLEIAGVESGLSREQVKQQLLARVTFAAKPFGNYSFTDFRTGRAVTIDDYKGRVVFVTFWFPSCGYCKEEYPFFQDTLERYQNRGFAVLAPNIHPEENNVAIDNMRAYNFTLLKVPTPDWESVNFHKSIAPVNFLLDASGRIAFQPRVDNTHDQELMEDEINLLLSGSSTSLASSVTAGRQAGQVRSNLK